MSFYTYILRCADNSYYTGHTEDLDQRFAQHQSGAIRGYTFDRRPVDLMWADNFATREEALSAELRIKGWSRAKKEALIVRDWDRLSRFALPPSERDIRASASLGIVPRLRSGGTYPADTPSRSVHPEQSRGARSSEVENCPEADGSKPQLSPPPIIVLVRPQLGENIGKAARAMLNFGLERLRLVAPRDGWPNPDAGPAASGADVVIANAQVYSTLAEAVADCSHVIATTVRRRGLIKPVVGADGAAAIIRAEPGQSALVFGPERSGLETDEVALARTILTVPVNPAFSSLNLAQAVILAAYEWSKGEGDALVQPPVVDLDPPAPQDALDGLIEALRGMLDKVDYFHPPARTAATMRSLRTLMTKPGWTAKEVQMLRGILGAIDDGPRG